MTCHDVVNLIQRGILGYECGDHPKKCYHIYELFMGLQWKSSYVEPNLIEGNMSYVMLKQAQKKYFIILQTLVLLPFLSPLLGT